MTNEQTTIFISEEMEKQLKEISPDFNEAIKTLLEKEVKN